MYGSTYTKLGTHCQSIDSAYKPLNIAKDQDFYAEFNIRSFSVPPDWTWEPCPGYYADDSIEFGQAGGESEELVYLQNRLAKSRKERERLTIVMNGQRECDGHSIRIRLLLNEHCHGSQARKSSARGT
jgi:hypothetical protein